MTGIITSEEFEVRCVNFKGCYDNSLFDTIVSCEPGILERKKTRVRNLIADVSDSVPVVGDAWEDHAPKVECFLNTEYAPEHFRIDFIVPGILILRLLAEDATTWEYVVYLSRDGTSIVQSCGNLYRSELVGTVLSVFSMRDGKKLFHADIAPLVAKFKTLQVDNKATNTDSK